MTPAAGSPAQDPPAANGPAPSQAVVVQLVKTSNGYELRRNGQPYVIKGAGGQQYLDLLKQDGGNSVRTWGADNLEGLLNRAQQLGLTVTVGIWLGHKDQGFDYHDPKQVAAQKERARQAILRYRNFPAVLLWGIGNEMEGDGNDPAVWNAVEEIARMAKQLDPAHPTMTVIAEVGGKKVENLHQYCPDIDIVGINSYAGAPSVARRYAAAGGTKPYVLTEFGPPGPWESAKTPWGAAIEPTSTEKAGDYRRAYTEAVLGNPGRCLGSYAFLWGNKQETTATWFGMFLPDGRRLAAVGTMEKLWSGRAPAHPCPVIRSLKIDSDGEVAPGALVHASLDAASPDGDPLTIRWVLQDEPSSFGAGGMGEQAPPVFPSAITPEPSPPAGAPPIAPGGGAARVSVRMPATAGGCRLFAYVYDAHNGTAVANVPLNVRSPEDAAHPGQPARLPLVLYGAGASAPQPYAPSGWMGGTQDLKLDNHCTTTPHSGAACIQVGYLAPGGWAGVAWQSPANNWGDAPGGWDLSGAKKLTFWARGETGGESVTFQFGLLDRSKKFYDTASGKRQVTLTKEWQEYAIDLRGKDLRRILTGFAFVVTGSGKPIRFYLDDIRYE